MMQQGGWQSASAALSTFVAARSLFYFGFANLTWTNLSGRPHIFFSLRFRYQLSVFLPEASDLQADGLHGGGAAGGDGEGGLVEVGAGVADDEGEGGARAIGGGEELDGGNAALAGAHHVGAIVGGGADAGLEGADGAALGALVVRAGLGGDGLSGGADGGDGDEGSDEEGLHD